MHRLWLVLGALAGLSVVALSAWAAHGAPAGFEETPRRAVQNALTIHGWHAFALLAAGLMAERGRTLAHAAGAAFAIGTVLFCGAVWWNALGNGPVTGIAPLGGMTLMAGWALLAASAFKR